MGATAGEAEAAVLVGAPGLEADGAVDEEERAADRGLAGASGGGAGGKVGRSSLVVQKRAAASSALDGGTSIGFAILQRMGWREGLGLGKNLSLIHI